MSSIPKILVSSVIRSTNRGDCHGGLYIVDMEKGTSEQVLDWNYPHISWDSGGGDRGLRGLQFYDGELYAAGARALFVFDENYELVRQYRTAMLSGTHETFLYYDNLLCVANAHDSILSFNVKEKQWEGAIQHILGGPLVSLDPETRQVPIFDEQGEPLVDENDPSMLKWKMLDESDTMHIDSVSAYNDWVFYAGSTTEHIYAFNIRDYTCIQQRLVHPNTHNAQPWKDGLIFNRSIESETCYQVEGNLVKTWKTPIHPNSITNFSHNDHARVGYTRGMVLTKDYVIVGTSPAAIHMFSMDSASPVQSVYLTDDVRNSVCCMCPLTEPEEGFVNWVLPQEQ
tara:strand:+ start:64745 stop:65767 length:1023 start_codon:yes stop_codon:yes gene_type:complete